MTDPAALKSLHIEYLDPRDLVLLTKNSRFMRHEEYQRLVDNIRRDGALTSVPLARLLEDGRYEVLSGNHRTRAAIDAGLELIAVMCVDDPLEADRAVAIQLSHNAIAGQDDPAILKELYDSIEDVDWRSFSGLDDATLDLLEKVEPVPISEAALSFTAITLVFLPSEVQRLKEAFELARDQVGGNEAWLMSMGDYDKAMDALVTVGGAHDVKNQAIAFRLLVELAVDNFEQLVEAWWDEHDGLPRHNGWIPLEAVVGLGQVPSDAAGVIRAALDKLVERGDVDPKSRWQGLELLAAEFLAGA